MNWNKNIMRASLVCAVMLLFIGSSFALTGQTKPELVKTINPVNLQPGQVITPFGTIMNKSQGYEVKSGGFIDMNNISRNATGEPIKVPTYNGWIEDTSYNPGSGIDHYSGNWIVPSSPSSTGSLIYLFIGLEPSDGSNILQPVLQWGNNGAFGGNYWTLASWYVTGSSYTYSTPINVNAGDTLYGEAYHYTSNPTYWFVNSVDQTQSTYTTLSTTASSSYPNSYVTLEGYNVNTCSQFPGATGFTNLDLYGITPYWTPNQLQTGCGLSISVISPTQVTLNT